MYYCLSWNIPEQRLAWNGCLNWLAASTRNRTIASTTPINYTWAHQRYGQYRLQYIDHNSDANNDNGDADASWSFIGDDDDLFLWKGPDAFTLWTDVWELYLINASWNERTYFRWKFTLDSDAPTTALCPTWAPGPKQLTWTWCLGTIQILKLEWEDTNGDGSVNEWIIHQDYVSDASRIVATSSIPDIYWQNIFSNRIHVSRAEFYLYPNQSLDYAWATSSTDRPDLQVAPYLQVRITLEPSWKERRRLRWQIPVVNITTTVSLSQVDIF